MTKEQFLSLKVGDKIIEDGYCEHHGTVKDKGSAAILVLWHDRRHNQKELIPLCASEWVYKRLKLDNKGGK